MYRPNRIVITIEAYILSHSAGCKIFPSSSPVCRTAIVQHILLQNISGGQTLLCHNILICDPGGREVQPLIRESQGVQCLSVLQRDLNICIGDSTDQWIVEGVWINDPYLPE